MEFVVIFVFTNLSMFQFVYKNSMPKMHMHKK